jgi:hypothetical protein
MDTGDMIHIRADRSQRILVCGKTGTGKSYTLGVLVEELARLESSIILVVDPQGIFWTMAESNSVASEADGLWAYDRSPSGFPLNLMVPGDPVERLDAEIVAATERRGVRVQSLRLNPSDLTPQMWCGLFDLDIQYDYRHPRYSRTVACGTTFGTRDFLSTTSHGRGHAPERPGSTKEAILR